jgi:hypothetical protein
MYVEEGLNNKTSIDRQVWQEGGLKEVKRKVL